MTRTPVLRVVCAWCTHVITAGTPGAPVSHGICDQCFNRVTAEEEASTIAQIAPWLEEAKYHGR